MLVIVILIPYCCKYGYKYVIIKLFPSSTAYKRFVALRRCIKRSGFFPNHWYGSLTRKLVQIFSLQNSFIRKNRVPVFFVKNKSLKIKVEHILNYLCANSTENMSDTAKIVSQFFLYRNCVLFIIFIVLFIYRESRIIWHLNEVFLSYQLQKVLKFLKTAAAFSIGLRNDYWMYMKHENISTQRHFKLEKWCQNVKRTNTLFFQQARFSQLAKSSIDSSRLRSFCCWILSDVSKRPTTTKFWDQLTVTVCDKVFLFTLYSRLFHILVRACILGLCSDPTLIVYEVWSIRLSHLFQK